jgi:FAD synthase
MSSVSFQPWMLRSVVVRGHQRGGSMLGFPTANMLLLDDTIEQLRPMENGVFFGWGVVEPKTDTPLPAVLSVGYNPHFSDKALTVEVHFVHKFDADFYGATMRILVLGRLRDQKKYNSLDDLIADIRQDVRRGTENLSEGGDALRQHPILSAPFRATDLPRFISLPRPSGL